MRIFGIWFGKRPFKETDKHEKDKKEKKLHDCDFGIKEFNKGKRDKRFVEEINGRGKGRGPKKPPEPPPTGTGNKVIFLDFDGHTVESSSWNVYGPIVCDYAGFTDVEKEQILASIQEDYAAFNVIVTMDETVFLASAVGSRVRVIFTESYEWYSGSTPTAGGVAYLQTFYNGSDDPCFVFTSALGYSVKYCKEAGSHEAGHTLGLRHQALCDGQNMLSSYNRGGNGEAPIMGVGYYEPDVHWWIGPTSLGCSTVQDDVKVLTGVLGAKV